MDNELYVGFVVYYKIMVGLPYYCTFIIFAKKIKENRCRYAFQNTLYIIKI